LDYVPFINDILSHWIFSPFATLTYGAYLWHPVIVKILAGSAEDYYMYSPLDAIERTVFVVVLAYVASMLSWVLIEKPMATLTTWMIPRQVKSRSPPAYETERHQIGSFELPSRQERPDSVRMKTENGHNGISSIVALFVVCALLAWLASRIYLV